MLKTQVMKTLNKRQKSTNERMLLGCALRSRVPSRLGTGRCHPAHSTPGSGVPTGGPAGWWRTRAKSRHRAPPPESGGEHLQHEEWQVGEQRTPEGKRRPAAAPGDTTRVPAEERRDA